MNNKTIKIEISVYMPSAQTRSDFIHIDIYIDSIFFIKTATSFNELCVFTTNLYYRNTKLQGVMNHCYGDWSTSKTINILNM